MPSPLLFKSTKKKIKPVIQLLIFVLLLQHLNYLLVANYLSDIVDHYDYRLELIAQMVEQLLVLDYSDFLVMVYFDCHFQMDYIPQDLFVYYLYFLQLVVWLDPIIFFFCCLIITVYNLVWRIKKIYILHTANGLSTSPNGLSSKPDIFINLFYH